MALVLHLDPACAPCWLALRHARGIAAATGVPLEVRPASLRRLRAAGAGPPGEGHDPPPRRAVLDADLARRFALAGARPVRTRPPADTLPALRLLAAAPPAARAGLAEDLLAATWLAGRDPADPGLLSSLGARHGVPEVDPARADARLRANEQALADRGAFGLPWIEVGDDGFWGADRFHLALRALGLAADLPWAPDTVHGGLRAPGTGPPPRPGGRFTFFHDFASPFSYLASCAVPDLARREGATVTWRPVLLGALFKAIGTPMVPLRTFSPARQAWALRDLAAHAAWWGVPFRFPSTFPLRTVLPLRLALVRPELTPRLYRAAWAEDLDIGDPEVLAAVVREAGCEPADLVAAATRPSTKAALRRNTEEAAALGVCGVPTFRLPDGTLIWGQDRLGLLRRLLRRPGGGPAPAPR